MNKIFKNYILFIAITTLFYSCKDEDKVRVEIRILGMINEFQINSNSNNSDTIKETLSIFPEFDSSKFKSVEDAFSLNDKKAILKDSVIILNLLKEVNGEKICCQLDTANYFIEKINEKNYMLVLQGYSVIVCEMKKDDEIKPRPRPYIHLPTWNIKVGSEIDKNAFKDSIYKYKSPISRLNLTLINRHLINNPDITLSSLEFPRIQKRVVTTLYKEVQDYELESFLDLIKEKYPEIKINEFILEDKRRAIEIYKNGLHISIFEIKNEDISSKKYSVTISDYYETAKTLVNKIGWNYKSKPGSEMY
jgi:hypothetical protein